MGLGAAEQEQPVAPVGRLPGEELAARPVDVPAVVGPQTHLRPLLGEHEELLGVDPREPLRPQIPGQIAQGAGGGAAGVDPPPEGDDHGGQVGGRLPVELDVVHAPPFRVLTTLDRRATVALPIR